MKHLLPTFLAICFAEAITLSTTLAQDADDALLLVDAEVLDATLEEVRAPDLVTARDGGRVLLLHLADLRDAEVRAIWIDEGLKELRVRYVGRSVRARLSGEALGADTRHEARVEIGGRDLREAVLESGLAWYCPEGAPEPRLVEALDRARAARKGLLDGAHQPPAGCSGGSSG